MKLLTKEVLNRFRKSERLPEADSNDRPILAKFFDPCGRGTWYAVEAEQSGEDWICFGWVMSPLGPDCDEWGYWSMAELAAVRRPFGLGIERDLHFPKGLTVREVREPRAYIGEGR